MSRRRKSAPFDAGTRDFRTTLICRCTADYAEGYGSSLTQAAANARHFFALDHGRRAIPREVIHERWNGHAWELAVES